MEEFKCAYKSQIEELAKLTRETNLNRRLDIHNVQEFKDFFKQLQQMAGVTFKTYNRSPKDLKRWKYSETYICRFSGYKSKSTNLG